jgi:hypothetical protein
MIKKLFIVETICVVILLLLCSSVSALAQTHFPLSKTESSISVSSGEDYEVYIGAGWFRDEGNGTFGLGWHMTVNNTGNTSISGVMYCKTTKLNGELIGDGFWPFSLAYPVISTTVGGWIIDFIPINFIYLSIEIGNKTYSRSGYEICSFVLLVD